MIPELVIERWQRDTPYFDRSLILFLNGTNSAQVFTLGNEDKIEKRLILIDQDLPPLAQIIALYHEMGHIMSDLAFSRKPNELDRENDANFWCLSHLIADDMKELAVIYFEFMANAVQSGKHDETYLASYKYTIQSHHHLIDGD